MLNAVGLWDRTLRRFLLKVPVRKHIEGLALIRALRSLVDGLFDRDWVAVSGPWENSHEVPALLKVDLIELREGGRARRSRRLPNLDLSCDANRPGFA
jgi:hypothetical protein